MRLRTVVIAVITSSQEALWSWILSQTRKYYNDSVSFIDSIFLQKAAVLALSKWHDMIASLKLSTLKYSTLSIYKKVV